MADIVGIRKKPEERGEPETSVAAVIGELITDAQKLIRQEAALLRADFQGSMESKTSHLLAQGIGGAMMALGAFWILAAVVYWLHEKHQLPIWIGAAAVGTGSLVLGAILAAAAGKTGGKNDRERRQ